jgi:hypothetical protein
MRIATEQKMPMRKTTGVRTRTTIFIDLEKLEAYVKSKSIDRDTMAAEYYTVGQAAEYLNVPRHMIDLWTKKGKIAREKLSCPFSGQLIVVIRKSEADRFRMEFLDRSRYRSMAATAVMAIRCAQRDSEVEIEMPAERIELRKYAVRLLTTRKLMDGTQNPYHTVKATDEMIDDIERRIVAGNVSVTRDQLPMRLDSTSGESQHYVYSPTGRDGTYRRVASY